MQDIRKVLKIIIKAFVAVLMGSLIGMLVGLGLFGVIIPFAFLMEVFLSEKYNVSLPNLYNVIAMLSIFLGQIIGLCTCMYLEFKGN